MITKTKPHLTGRELTLRPSLFNLDLVINLALVPD